MCGRGALDSPCAVSGPGSYKWVIHGSHEIPGEEDVAVEGEDAAGKSALHVARIKAFNQLPTYGSHYTDGLSSKAAQVA